MRVSLFQIHAIFLALGFIQVSVYATNQNILLSSASTKINLEPTETVGSQSIKNIKNIRTSFENNILNKEESVNFTKKENNIEYLLTSSILQDVEQKKINILNFLSQKTNPELLHSIEKNLLLGLECHENNADKIIFLDKLQKILKWYVGVSKKDKEFVKKETTITGEADRSLDLDVQILEIIGQGDIKKMNKTFITFKKILNDLKKQKELEEKKSEKNKENLNKNKNSKKKEAVPQLKDLEQRGNLWNSWYYDDDGYDNEYDFYDDDDREPLDLEYNLEEDNFGVHEFYPPDSSYIGGKESDFYF